MEMGRQRRDRQWQMWWGMLFLFLAEIRNQFPFFHSSLKECLVLQTRNKQDSRKGKKHITDQGLGEKQELWQPLLYLTRQTGSTSMQHTPHILPFSTALPVWALCLLLCLCKQAAWEEMYVIQLRQDHPRVVRNQQHLCLSSSFQKMQTLWVPESGKPRCAAPFLNTKIVEHYIMPLFLFACLLFNSHWFVLHCPRCLGLLSDKLSSISTWPCCWW